MLVKYITVPVCTILLSHLKIIWKKISTTANPGSQPGVQPNQITLTFSLLSYCSLTTISLFSRYSLATLSLLSHSHYSLATLSLTLSHSRYSLSHSRYSLTTLSLLSLTLATLSILSHYSLATNTKLKFLSLIQQLGTQRFIKTT